MKIHCKALTTCGVHMEGETIGLNLKDQSGNDVSLRLSFLQAEALSMTLPQLLTRALVTQTGNPGARYVFPLCDWSIEKAEESDFSLLTLGTDNGFKVSFGLTKAACEALGEALVAAHNSAERSDVEESHGARTGVLMN